MKTIRGKLALVTGAASGIGRSIAAALAREGADLFLVDRDEPQLTVAAKEIRRSGVAVIPCVCDLAEPAEIDRAVASVMRAWGGVDILVNNAGIAYYGPTHLMTAEQWDRILHVNLHAPIHFIRKLLPVLLVRSDAHILNVSSIAGLVASSRLAAYHVTKFGLVGFSEALRAEYGPRGLGVTALCPGLVRTNIYQSAMNNRPERPMPTPPAWICASPEDVAKRAIRAIRRNQGLVLVTPMAHFLWGLKRLSPALLDSIQRFRLRRSARPAQPPVGAVPYIASPAVPFRKAG
jgi:short-subunit dehydrogenase